MIRREFIAGLGSVVAWPVVARAQQGDRVRRIGVLMRPPESDMTTSSWIKAFRQGLEAAGWIEGRNITVEYRWGPSSMERLRTQAAELTSLKPDVILTAGAVPLLALQHETRVVPIVFAGVTEPVAGGFVGSMAHPGGNITGFTNYQYTMAGKWLELLKEIAPRIEKIGVIDDPLNADWPGYNRVIDTAAPSFGMRTMQRPVSNVDDVERTLSALGQEPDAGLIVLPDAFLLSQSDLLIARVAQYRLPTIYPLREFAAAGGLISYGPVFNELFRGAASYVDRILRGEKPDDLPVQAPNKFELVMNLRTAKDIGLSIAESFLLRADEVIE